MSQEILTPEEVEARKIRRILILIAHRTEYGTFKDDEESNALSWLLEERARLQGDLDSAKDSIKKLTEILLQNGEMDGDDL